MWSSSCRRGILMRVVKHPNKFSLRYVNLPWCVIWSVSSRMESARYALPLSAHVIGYPSLALVHHPTVWIKIPILVSLTWDLTPVLRRGIWFLKNYHLIEVLFRNKAIVFFWRNSPFMQITSGLLSILGTRNFTFPISPQLFGLTCAIFTWMPTRASILVFSKNFLW